jgi:two-component system nitrogen regulation response regulator GlnG/two-component system response regulator HydG
MSDTTAQTHGWLDRRDHNPDRSALALVLVWSLDEPGRVGEVGFVDGTLRLGRGGEGPGWVAFHQVRPGRALRTGPLRARTVSREQLVVTAGPDALEVRNVGRGTLCIDGRPTDHALAAEGQIVEVQRKVAFLVVRRRRQLPALEGAWASHAFGTADPHGFVGEAPAVWALRGSLGFAATNDGHVLLLGPSGSGKEHAARTVHQRSARCEGPLVARSAATLPESLAEAELFGNREHYQNPGIPDRPGLVGAAHRGVLFLDEIGELPGPMQGRLLRVLDDGQYHRLGEAYARRADLRLLAATNRDATVLQHDLHARFRFEVTLPPLSDRREDVPLLVRHLLALAAARQGLERFREGSGPVRVSPELMTALVRHDYERNVRELDALLWTALAKSPDGFLDLTEAVRDKLGGAGWQAWVGHDAAGIPRGVLQACLDAHNGSQEQARKALGLSSRHQLARLIKRHGLVVRKTG